MEAMQMKDSINHRYPSRRQFLAGLGAAGVVGSLPRASTAQVSGAGRVSCPFRLSVINDEISDDLDHACNIAANEFGLQWIELRAMWHNTKITELDAAQVDRALKILDKYKLRVTDIAANLFKVDWPDAPPTKKATSGEKPVRFASMKDQDEMLERSIAMAKTFGTDRIRCFDFQRIEDVKPYREAINAKLSEAARLCAKSNLILLLENEGSCNTRSAKDAVETLKGVPETNFMLNWDAGNDARLDTNVAYPNDYNLLPKHRIGHIHAKDVVRDADGKSDWAPVGAGIIDWVGQLRALRRDGYKGAVSLETHWKGGGKPEECSRISMKGLKEVLAKAVTSC
jgi:sugar phosphate isomerase/epimerase